MLLPAGGAQAANVQAFFEWAQSSGAGIANDLGYVALPADVAALARQAMR